MIITSPINHLPKSQQETVLNLAQKVRLKKGRALLVGGCVRDGILNQPVDERHVVDVDMEVYGITADDLLILLKKDYEIDAVGQSFGIFKVRKHHIDVALPRRESKMGQGHRGFLVTGDPMLEPEEALLRRDFTINAILWDPLTNEVMDPLNGMKDLEDRVLRHCSEHFSEDPLRVLRAMQLIARFELNVDPRTLNLCRTIQPEELSKERIFGEWKKLITWSKKPSLGLNFLKDCGWVQYYPQLLALIGCQQREDRHPEGDAWTHTLHCMDAFAKERLGDEWEDLVVGFAVLCHDFGKPTKSAVGPDGIIHAYGHEEAGESPTRAFLGLMTEQKDLIESVVVLVKNHRKPKDLFEVQATDAAVRRLAHSVKRLDRLIRVCIADKCGRPPMKKEDFPELEWIINRARILAIMHTAPSPIILGRHLIERGLHSGPMFTSILERCFQAQLDGKFHNTVEAMKFLDDWLDQHQIR